VHAGVAGVKGVKIRLSRTLVLVLGGVVVLGGGSGAVALYIGADKLLGPSYAEINGLECTTAQLVKIKRDHRYWVRKYVVTAEPGDGLARLKTALRVARSVQAAEKADLVQVSVLDKSGPTQRAGMRGRAIGAQVVYIPTPAKEADTSDPVYSAFYFDGPVAPNGEYFGLRVDPPLEDIEKLAASLTDTADCVSPVAESDAKGDGHGAPKGKDAHGGGHEAAPPAHGAEAGADLGHGEKTDEHGAPPAAAGGHGGEAAPEPESGGLISSLKNMVFGKSEETAEAKAPVDAHGAADKPAETADAAAHSEPNAQPSPEHTAVATEPGMFSRMKAMVFGADAPKTVVEQVPQPPAAGEPLQSHAAAPAHDGIDPMKVAAPTDAKDAPSKPAVHQAEPPAKAATVSH
jgi:hypothetical protein